MFEPTWKSWSGHAAWSGLLAGLIGWFGSTFDGFVMMFLVMLVPSTFVCFGPARLRDWVNEAFR